MVAVATDLKDLLVIKGKSRIDTFSDQYNRLFMVRLMMICTIIMGFSWYTDSISCIVPETHNIDGGFVSAACWIQGVYVYKELQTMVNRVAYFGMPKNMDHEGMIEGTSELCNLRPKLGQKRNEKCIEMTKRFFLQYQYMPFFVAALAILYYLPYIAFRTLNKDKQSLKDDMKKDDKCAKSIVENHFRNYAPARPNESRQMTVRVVLNIIIKILYILSNVVALLALNNVLNDEFITYGSKFIQWTRLNNTVQYDYMGMRDHPKPGNQLLPPFGYCEMYESARDVKTTLANAHKFVCEISQNILYQYCLAVLWFAIIAGILISVFGLIHCILMYLIDFAGLRFQKDDVDFTKLHVRDRELMAYIHEKDRQTFVECVQMLPKNSDNPPKKAYNTLE